MADQFIDPNDTQSAGNEASYPSDNAPPEQPPAPQYQPPQPPFQQPGAYPPPGYYPPQGHYYPPKPPKDRSLAIILEILPGIFGILGLGWLYSGNVGAGIGWLMGMLFWDLIAMIVAAFTTGVGLLCTVPISILLLVLSAVSLNGYTKKHPELFGA